MLRKSDIPHGGFDFFSLSLGPKVLPRTLLLDILKSKLHTSNCKVYTSKCLTSYTASDKSPVVLHFEDGTTSTADILIGADGVHSNVRKTLFKDQPRYAEPRFSGQFAYRMRCLQEDLRKINKEHLALSGFKIVRRLYKPASMKLTSDSGVEKADMSLPTPSVNTYK